MHGFSTENNCIKYRQNTKDVPFNRYKRAMNIYECEGVPSSSDSVEKEVSDGIKSKNEQRSHSYFILRRCPGRRGYVGDILLQAETTRWINY